MLAKRVIPTMLCRGRTLVKGKGFAGDRSVGHVMQAAQIHARRGVDELCILDIGATAEGRGPDLDMVRQLSEGCYIPITVGGGVKSLDDIDALLRAGADKVAIGSALVDCPDLAEAAAARFGKQAIVAVIDYRSVEGHPCVKWHNDRRTLCVPVQGKPYFVGPRSFALNWSAKFAGEILLQCIERDGTMTGYDLDLIREVSEAVSIPVIASGGCSSEQNAADAIKAGADAVAIGALFLFTEVTPRSVARYLQKEGVCVRI